MKQKTVLCVLCWKAIHNKKITVRPGSSDDAFVSPVIVIVIQFYSVLCYSSVGASVIGKM